MTEQPASSAPIDLTPEDSALIFAQAVPTVEAPPIQPAPAQAPPAPPAPTAVAETVAPPAAGERVIVGVQPGTEVLLPDPIFDPDQARYLVDGNDLVVTLPTGGVLILDNFFAYPNDPATLSVTGAPPVSASTLLESMQVVQQAQVAQPPQPPEPQPPPETKPVHAGGAGFSPYDPGELPPGLDPLGPLGPTALQYSAEFPEPRVWSTGPREHGPSAAAPPPPEPPSITARSEVTGTIAEISSVSQLPSAVNFPSLTEGKALPESQVNGVDQRALTSGNVPISVVFEATVAKFENSIGFYTVGSDGAIHDTQILFPNARTTAPGTEVPLPAMAPGTEFGFFLVQNAGAQIDALHGGTFELRNAAGEPASIDDTGGLTLYHVPTSGPATPIKALVFMTFDPTEGSPNSNPLNPDGIGHTVSGFDPGPGGVLIGMEDVVTRGPGIAPSDRDFNDSVFSVRYGEVPENVLFLPDQAGRLDVHITDPDSTQMRAATAEITSGAKTGDFLALIGFPDADHDGKHDQFNISFEQVSPTKITFSGLDTIEHYQDVMNLIRYGNETNPSVGVREVTLTVTDDKGATSPAHTVPIDIHQLLFAGDDGPNHFVGTDLDEAFAGRGGNDTIEGRGGDDLISGGAGDDVLNGGDGHDILDGGTGRDLLTGGPGPDEFMIRSLTYGLETVTSGDFNPSQGDRLNMADMFAPTSFDPETSDVSQWIKLVQGNSPDAFNPGNQLTGNDIQVQVDLDGPGSNFAFQPVANLIAPVGVTTATDPSSIVITSQPHQGGSDGATT